MRITGILWLRQFAEKIDRKHGVAAYEVEAILYGHRRVRLIERGDYEGEDVFEALGQTEEGRYLAVFFVFKRSGDALVISARDMTRKERRRYGRR
ncbi:MAG: BrnT family toxin [Chloroflexi bacterium]|nr:BrnT family toxin [Chloroflexota bacterium]